MAFDRFNDKPARRPSRFSDRSERGDRFAEGKRFGDSNRFGDGNRGNRFDSDRGEFGGRGVGRPNRERGEGFGGRANDNRRFPNDRQNREGRSGGFRGADASRAGFARLGSGPRAKAFEKRRFTDRSAFVQRSVVHLDADVAEYFKTPEAVNQALRQLIALSQMISANKPSVAEAEESEVQPVQEAEISFDEDDEEVVIDTEEKEQA